MRTLSDVIINLFITLFLILPGFLSINIMYWALKRKHQFSTFEMTSMSMLISMFIIGIVIITTAFLPNRPLDLLTLENITPTAVSLYILLSLYWACVIGYWVSIVIVWKEKILLYRLLPFVKSEREYSLFESTWAECFEHYDGMVSIITHDGKEYSGRLETTSTEDFPREITIKIPKLIIRDDTGNLQSKKEMGIQMLFTEKDIRRIICWNE